MIIFSFLKDPVGCCVEKRQQEGEEQEQEQRGGGCHDPEKK